ncbi:hypothetical protein [Streptomyces tubercidicus]|uniref:hypothetical protein n=1 Tax=Streptomyces tubercidicus TaxID=47759 RepID=UPI0037BA8A91
MLADEDQRHAQVVQAGPLGGGEGEAHHEEGVGIAAGDDPPRVAVAVAWVLSHHDVIRRAALATAAGWWPTRRSNGPTRRTAAVDHGLAAYRALNGRVPGACQALSAARPPRASASTAPS